MIKNINRKLRNTFSTKTKRQRQFLNRLIWVTCLSVCIPIILAGAIYYRFSVIHRVQQIRSESESSLKLISTRTEHILQKIERDSFEVAKSKLLNDTFAMENFSGQYLYHGKILDALLIKQYDNKFVGEIYYYNVDNNFVLANEYGYVRLDDYKYKKDIEMAMEMDRPVGWAHLPEASKNQYISFARKLPILSSKPPQSLVMFYIKQDAIADYLDNGTRLSDQHHNLIIDSQGQLLFFSGDHELNMSSLIGDDVIKEILEQYEDSGNFFAKSPNDESVLYTFVKTGFGRTYISVIPRADITKQLSWIHMFTLLTILLFLAIAITITIFNSRRVYNPLEKLLHYGEDLSKGRIQSQTNSELDFIRECLDYLNSQTETLNDYIDSIGPTLQQNFLQQLLQGAHRGGLLYKECEANHISTDGYYIVIVAYVENLHKEKRFNMDEKPIITFAITNIMEEILRNRFQMKGYIVNSNQGRGIAIIHFPDDVSRKHIMKNIHEYGEAIREVLWRYLSFSVSIGIGRIYTSVADIQVSYQEAINALRYRLYRNEDYILYIGDVEGINKQTIFIYPYEVQNMIIESLIHKNDIEKAKKAFEKFSSTIQRSQSYNLIHQSYQVLLSSITIAFQEKGGDIFELLTNNLHGELNYRQTFSEIYDWFIEDLFPFIIELLCKNQSANTKTNILKICKYIKNNITADISLVQCAELVNMSPSYISRIFKEYTGMSFLDYVKQCKMEEAKNLLLNTDYRISEIAQTLRYSERNLYRLFKRHFNMSPSEFRTINQ